MLPVKGRIALTLVALAVAGCGGSSAAPESGGARAGSSPAGAIRAWYGAAANGDGRRACALMTAHGRRAIEASAKGRGCRATLSRTGLFERPKRVGPTGRRGQLALVAVAFQAKGSRAIGVLRREGGR